MFSVMCSRNYTMLNEFLIYILNVLQKKKIAVLIFSKIVIGVIMILIYLQNLQYFVSIRIVSYFSNSKTVIFKNVLTLATCGQTYSVYIIKSILTVAAKIITEGGCTQIGFTSIHFYLSTEQFLLGIIYTINEFKLKHYIIIFLFTEIQNV